ncbi:MAG TPA: ABC transporter ATP-binding protein [Tepidisphaeraceae bacterium]|jgi:lipoprotein-releasing system ATP-binding protein|nr:ABC transporter ATP-binding protein [Tepidisphaeraceae bacterium]
MSQAVRQPELLAVEKDRPILRAQAIKRTFRMGQEVTVVLKHVDLTLRKGEFVAIEGRSGSGKSTLLHILGTLDEADSGTIEFNGQDLSRLTGGERSQIRNTQFGFVFQFYHLLPELNVTENTLLAPMIEYSWLGFRKRQHQLKERAKEILSELGLEHRLRHKVTVLSGGERQRVAIARALMNSPQILFADEPTGNLDAETGRQIMGVLEKLHREQGQTIVLVTHDRSLARQADRVLVLRDGKLEKPGESNNAESPATLNYR